MKRLFDIVFSFVALSLFFPVGFVVAFLIKIVSEGPVFHACIRMGKGGKTIRCWKFRTMCADADTKLKELLENNPILKKEWEMFQKIKDDPRIHKMGKFLRKTSLDEWPQFWNVLVGDLSVVGPRPATEEEMRKHYGDKAQKILSVRPGLTGIWQTSGRNLLTFEDRVRMDETYIDQQSLKLDLKIICRTIPELFFAKGAF